MIFDITPVSKPRMTQRDKRPPVRPEVGRYRAFADEIRLKANLKTSLIYGIISSVAWNLLAEADFLFPPNFHTCQGNKAHLFVNRQADSAEAVGSTPTNRWALLR